jgi:hypothetical protein
MAIVMGEMIGTNHSWVWFLLGWWDLLFSHEWWDLIWYRFLGSPVVCTGGNWSYPCFLVITGDPQ